MSKNRQEIAEETLKTLQVLAAGQSASAEDINTVKDSIDVVVDDLATRNVVYIADPDALEDRQLKWLAVVMASAMAMEFGTQIDPSLVALAEKRLREQEFIKPVATLAPDYF